MDDSEPTAFEAVTRHMVEVMERELREIRRRVDGLLWLGAGALLSDLVMRLIGTN